MREAKEDTVREIREARCNSGSQLRKHHSLMQMRVCAELQRDARERAREEGSSLRPLVRKSNR